MRGPNETLAAILERVPAESGFRTFVEVRRMPGQDPGPLIDTLIAALRVVRRQVRQQGAETPFRQRWEVEVVKEPAGEGA